MDKRLSRYLPPGADIKQTLKSVMILLSCAALWNIFVFTYRYYHAWENLYLNQIYRWVLRPDAQMPDFSALLQGGFVAYLIFLCTFAGLAVSHYLSFYQGSVSAYVMRRIPDAKELHVRCLTVPVCAAALMTALIILLLFIQRTVYVTFPPAQCLGNTSIDFFRILFMRG